jgi:GntR family transcriptional regulator of vanillate catabolism
MKLGEVLRVPLAHQIAERLRALIVDGTIEPGTPLLQEKVAAELGVSRTPLREAFRILEQDGLVRVAPRSGTVGVVRLTVDDATQLYQLREVIDGLSARLAAEHSLTSAQERQLKGYAQQIVRSVTPFNTSRFLHAHTAFHLGVANASGNQWMTQFDHLIRISSHMLYPILKSEPERMVASAAEHVAILDAIIAGDAERAEQLARSHVRLARSFWVPESGDRADRPSAALSPRGRKQ